MACDLLKLESYIFIVFAIFTGALGYGMGREKAFLIKLQAQIALCQAKIEENTRKEREKK